jgi:mono/diheme cytochrome c family protein
MRNPPVPLFALLASALTPLAPAAEPDVQRIFAEHCLECHGPDDKKGGLALTARENLFKELESGATALVPGDPAKSELIARILSSDPDEQMPPTKKKRLTAPEIEALKKWVASGAEWKQHWAYAPIARTQPPQNPNFRFQFSNPIDAFVFAKLAGKKIAPSPEADRYTLIRRVYFDLLGLPPTPLEADAFVQDTTPDACERLVDRALASPHFGERWGRHWLDRARYADSDGYEKDRARPDAWRYRDWVIDAVNRDLPFDQFTIEQLAGDLLPNATPEQKLATAFHRQTLTNTEGGTDQEQFRVEATFDRTETTGSVWLAHTVGCARCHTHKYDAITQREYYQLFAFFNNADETKTTVATSANAEAEYERKNAAHAAKLKKLTAKVAIERERLAARLLDWEKETAPRLAAAEGATAKQVPIEIYSVSSEADVEFQRLDDGSWLATTEGEPTDAYTVVADLPPGVISGLRLEVLPDESLPKNGPGRAKDGNFVLSKVTVEARDGNVGLHSPDADFSQAAFPVATALEGRVDKGWGIAPKAGAAHHANFQLVRPLEGGQRITVSLAHRYAKGSYTIGRFRLVALVGETPESIAPKTVRNFIAIGPEKWTNDTKDALVEWLEQVDPAASRVAAELAAAKAAAPPPPVLDVRILTQRKQPRETKVLHRGEFLQPGDPVAPGTLAVLPPIAAREGKVPDRLDLAGWLVSERNPLTPRVIVNQFWMQLFGEGLVRTAGDFGVRGDKPTHPELLDWLASEFIARHWSRKQMLRLILTSATYRQRSEVRPELTEIDPLNLLLARQNRIRVEGEIVRDLHLAASGLLAAQIGGPSVFPPMPPEIAALSYANNFKWTDSKDEDRYRRGMYTFFKRTAPHPDLTTFDCPDANLTAIKRGVSNTPLQALTTLNAQTFAEAAQAMAKRVLAEPLADDEARLTRAFRLAVTRPPQARELTALAQLLEKARAHYGSSADPKNELAAWTATVRIVLNMDEFITRE